MSSTNPQLTSDELRRRRLNFFDKSNVSSDNNDGGNTVESLCVSSSSNIKGKNVERSSNSNDSVCYNLSSNFYNLLWSIIHTNEEDKLRWFQQDITFRSTTITDDGKLFYGLVQNHGGPCGVLAGIQAEIICCSYLEGEKYSKKVKDDSMDEEEIHFNQYFIYAMARILVRAARDKVKVILPCDVNWNVLLPKEKEENYEYLEIYTLPNDESSLVDFLSQQERVNYFRKAGGVFLFVLCLIESRTISIIKQDMDDANCTLISQYGHCSQEFLNLLLTGAATSNVFDDMIKLDTSYSLKGIQTQPKIGYLTQLESLRYCQVGYFYKNPLNPVWVIGSTNHFTCLFCLDPIILGDESDKNEPSNQENMKENVHRIFRSVEDMTEGNGFVRTESLSEIIQKLDLMKTVGGEDGVQALAAALEINGAGIILWNDFWNVARQFLIENKSLSHILQNDLSTSYFDANTVSNKTSEDLVHQLHNQEMESLRKQQQSQQQSDEDLARSLQAQWDAEDANAADTTAIQPYNNTSDSNFQLDSSAPMELLNTTQEENESIICHNGDVSDQDLSNQKQSDSPILDYLSSEEDNKLTIIPTDQEGSKNKKRTKGSFDFYHYNGLRGGILTKFQITPFPKEHFEEVECKMDTSSNTNLNIKPTALNMYSGDLEDVIRTKWPKCKLYEWEDLLGEVQTQGVTMAQTVGRSKTSLID